MPFRKGVPQRGMLGRQGQVVDSSCLLLQFRVWGVGFPGSGLRACGIQSCRIQDSAMQQMQTLSSIL